MDQSLVNTLRHLQSQLQQLQHVDAEQRAELEVSVREIQESLDRFDIRSSDLAKRFYRSTEQFSEIHPNLTQTAGEVAGMLSQMGI